MIQDTTTRTAEGNITGESIAMGIHADAMQHIMGVLTDLYADPELAIIREYSTNAADAHAQMGVTRPIEVSTPSALDPFLRIRDYGIGLTVDDVREIYSQYGASTKRSTNDLSGMLGLGCKSALTYTDQFTVVAVKNGVKAQVMVSRDTSGAGSMTVIDTSTTDDPQGVEVVIPAARHNTIRDKAGDFFSYWPEGSVLLDGKAPWRVGSDDPSDPGEGAFWLTPELLIRPRHDERGYNDSRIVMGNVSYPWPNFDAEALNLSWGVTAVAFVPIGAVDFAPSREALNEGTATTKATLAGIHKAAQDAWKVRVQDAVDAAPSLREAVRTAHSAVKFMRRAPSVSSYTYKGATLPQQVDTPDSLYVDWHSHKLDAHSTPARVDSQAILDAAHIVGFDRDSFTPTVKKKLMQHFETQVDAGTITQADVPRRFILSRPEGHVIQPPAGAIGGKPRKVAKLDLSTWTDTVIDWQVIHAIKLPQRARAAGATKITGSYDAFVGDRRRREVVAADIDTTGPIYWWHSARPYYSTASQYAEALEKFYGEGGKYTLVLLPDNRIDKFLRDFPGAEKVDSVGVKLNEAWQKSLTPEQIKALTIRGDINHLSMFDERRLDDPALVEAIKLAKKMTKKDSAGNTPLTKLTGQRIFLDKFTTWDDGITKPDVPKLSSYPLLPNHYWGGSIDPHVYIYLNAVYAATTNKIGA